jgi:hypothetical protein
MKTVLKTAYESQLNKLFGVIGFLQLIVFLPIVNVKFPAIAEEVNVELIQVATFQLIDTDEIFPLILDLDTKEEKPYNSRFNTCGFGGTNFVMTLGSLYIVFMWLLFKLVILATTCGFKNKYCLKVRHFFTSHLLWSEVIDYMLQSYIDLSFAVLLQFGNLKWSTMHLYFSNFSFMFLCFLWAVMPFWQGIWLFRNYYKLDNDVHLEAIFGPAYNGLDLKRHRWLIIKPLLYLFKRFYLVVILMFLKDYAIL